jgi:hypothetical protein
LATVDLKGLSKEFQKLFAEQSELVQAYWSGVFCGPRKEPEHNFYEAPCEKVIKGQNNSYIVFGRDRPSTMQSGYGGKGHTRCSAIDIVVGRMGANPREVNEAGEDVYCHPNLELDAARIYISHKTDVDNNFKLVDGGVGNAKSRSAIALKADGIRIIGREGIKLITRADRKNSCGGDIGMPFGIDLLAGNDDSDLQPIPKGHNVSIAIENIYDEIDALGTVVGNLVMMLMEFNKDLLIHTHTVGPMPVVTAVGLPAPFVAGPGTTLPINSLVSPIATLTNGLLNKCTKGIMASKSNIYKKMVLATDPSQPDYINSRFNRVN